MIILPTAYQSYFASVKNGIWAFKPCLFNFPELESSKKYSTQFDLETNYSSK